MLGEGELAKIGWVDCNFRVFQWVIDWGVKTIIFDTQKIFYLDYMFLGGPGQ